MSASPIVPGAPTGATVGTGAPAASGALRLSSHGREVAGETSAVQAWMTVMTKFLRGPQRDKLAIREELESHLEERVRDLMVGGQSETVAARTAIAELGEAAEVARRFEDARTQPRRRLAMNLGLIGLAGGAMIMSLVAMTQPGGRNGASVYRPERPDAKDAAVEGRRFDVSFTNESLVDAFSWAGQSAELTPVVSWKAFEAWGVSADTQVAMNAKQVTLEQFFTLLNEGAAIEGARYDYRVRERTLEIATTEYFDKREIELVCYDISGVLPVHRPDLEAMTPVEMKHRDQQLTEELVGVITSFVYPETWRDNGGLYGMSVVGSKMFVEAPRRHHHQIRWVIEQFLDRGDSGAASTAPSTEELPVATPRDPVKGAPAGTAAGGRGR
ncbi:MAG: hypothetical protein H7Y88_02360 [Phycisphaerales bacterium]|nr:hypothetical protein [Phycisphaerales bacterium]